MFSVFLFISVASSLQAEVTADKNSHWETDGPSRNTEILNWWETDDSFVPADGPVEELGLVDSRRWLGVDFKIRF